MVSIERISYEIGGVIADIILLSMIPSSVFRIYKVTKKFSKFAIDQSTIGFTDDQLTENIFDCLPFID